MKPCIPPELRAKADEAVARKNAAIERLRSLAVDAGALEEDPFMDRMADLIDADKKVIQMRGRR